MIQPLDIGVLKGKWYDPAAWPIMWRSLSPYTHCVIFLDSIGNIYDPTVGGIHKRNIDHYKGRDIAILRYKCPLNTQRLLLWLEQKFLTCKGYDYLAWAGFATGIKELQDEDRWFCSELPYWMFQDNGLKLTNEDVTFIYPSDLVNNPLLEITSRISHLKTPLTAF